MTLPVTLVQGAYIVAGLAFILALAGLSRHDTARAGNRFGIIGMAIALVATIWAATGGVKVTETGAFTVGIEGSGWLGLALILAAMGIGAAIGLDRARKVEMTGMPELIAMLHSFVGLAAVLVGWNSSYETTLYPRIHSAEVMVGVFIGAVTFTGSIVAFLKLRDGSGPRRSCCPGATGSTSARSPRSPCSPWSTCCCRRMPWRFARRCSGWSP